MLLNFESLKNFLRLRDISIDNGIFQLHYRWTVLILLVFSIVVSLKQYWGDAILCTSTYEKQNKKVLETFCWIETTFTIPSAYNDEVGSAVPYPGIKNSKGDKSSMKYHAFYQWVGLTLFFQAVLFCVPRFIWKEEEGCLMKNLVQGLNVAVSKKEDKEKVERLTCYLKSSWGTHDRYVAIYLLCEIVNFVNVVLQLVLMEKFLSGSFSSYALQVIGLAVDPFEQDTSMYPGFWVFPRMTKCRFHAYGPGGDVIHEDAYCLMPLNVIHDKIYVFLFLWFLILAVASALIIVLRLVSISMLEYREKALASRAALSTESTVRRICQKCSFGDWFFLKLLVKNISSKHCQKIMADIAEEMPFYGFTPAPISAETVCETSFQRN